MLRIDSWRDDPRDDGIASDAFAMNITVHGTSALCALRGEVDLATAPRFADELDRLVKGGVQTIVLDLGDVTFFGVEGLNIVLNSQRRLGERAGVSLRQPTPIITRMVQACGMEVMLDEERNGLP